MNVCRATSWSSQKPEQSSQGDCSCFQSQASLTTCDLPGTYWKVWCGKNWAKVTISIKFIYQTTDFLSNFTYYVNLSGPATWGKFCHCLQQCQALIGNTLQLHCGKQNNFIQPLCNCKHHSSYSFQVEMWRMSLKESEQTNGPWALMKQLAI